MLTSFKSWLKSRRALHPFLMDYDGYERHKVAQILLGQVSVQSVLDVGGQAGFLGRFLDCATTALNVDGTGDVRYDGREMPFADGAFDAVVTLDTLEHLPSERRIVFLRECLRVTRHCLLVAAPFGSEGHRSYEMKLSRIHRERCGKPHLFLEEHVRFGIPDESDISRLAHDLGFDEPAVYYAGDYIRQCRVFERGISDNGRKSLMSRVTSVQDRIFSRAIFNRIRLHRQVYPRANRFYMLFSKVERSKHE